MTIKNNQINSNFHQIAVVDADGLVTGIETGGVVLSDAANLTIGGGAAGQALITDGAGNLSWSTVDSANAAYANTAGVADVALSVDAANIVGEVANATFATSASSATVAASANAVALANVTGVGNIASVNLNGNGSQYLAGNGSWAATASFTPLKYTREWHVSPDLGNDTTGNGSYEKPYKTIMKAHSVIISGEAVFLHGGVYTENVTWTKTNCDIIGLTAGGLIDTSGTWTVGTTTGASVRLRDVSFNGTFTQNGTGRVFFNRCSVKNSFTKTSGEYLQANDTEFGTSVSINSAGTVVIKGGQLNGLTVNNASAVVNVSNLISGAVFTNTAGTLLVNDSIIYSATPTTAAITAAAGSVTYMYNSSTATSSGTQARVTFAGFWTVDSTRFDRANSTITGTNLGIVSYSDALTVFGITSLGAVGNVKITGGSNGQVLTTNGSGNLSWTTVSSGGNVAYANVAGVAYSVDAANVSGKVANASVADVAYSVAAANVSGKVSSASSADVALSVAGANVTGAGNVGQVQFASASGNLTSTDRYYFAGNGTAGLNISRDSGGAAFIGSIYTNTATFTTSITNRARGTKAAPLPVQVGDRLSALYSYAYTGTGTGTSDGVSGFVTNLATGVLTSVTSLPTGNGNTPGTSLSLVVANSAANNQVLATFREDGVFTTPKINAYEGASLGEVSNLTITGGTAGQVLSTDGAGNLTFTSNVANAGYADTASTANGVARGNVGGVTGNAGQIQFNNTSGNLTSTDRYYFGANGTGAINISRDNAATAISTTVYSNVSGPHSVSARARGTKAAPLPVQVGDRICGMSGAIYTGTGSATYDGVAGFATLTSAPAVSFDVTELPTGSANLFGSKMVVRVTNAAANSVYLTNFNDNGVLETPKLRVTQPNIPASATAPGQYGEIVFDFDYVYVCVNDNVWKRSALTTW